MAPEGAFLSIDNCPGVCEEDQHLRMCLDVTAQPLVDSLEMTAVGFEPTPFRPTTRPTVPVDRCLLCWFHLLEGCWRGCATSGGRKQGVAPRRSLVSNQAAIAQLGERQTEDLKVPVRSWVSASVLLGAPTISSQRTVAQGSVVEFCLEYKISLGTNTSFSLGKNTSFLLYIDSGFCKGAALSSISRAPAQAADPSKCDPA